MTNNVIYDYKILDANMCEAGSLFTLQEDGWEVYKVEQERDVPGSWFNHLTHEVFYLRKVIKTIEVKTDKLK